EPLLECSTDASPIELAQPRDRCNCLGLGINDEARYAIVYNLRDRPRPKSNNRGATRHGFDHDQAEGFGPVDWKEQGGRAGQKVLLLVFVDLPGEPDLIVIDQRF